MVGSQVHIARHFWRDGKVAEWKASHHFPQALLHWLKKNYSELVAGNRSEWIDWSEGSCHLIFTDDREVNGRMATRLTACWVKENIIDHDKFIDELRQIEGLVDDESLLCFATGASIRIPPRLKKARCILLGAIFLLIAGAGYLILDHQIYNPGPSPESILLSDQKAVTQGHILEKQKGQSTYSICSERPRKPERCYQHYIQGRCTNRIRKTTSYDNWLRELPKQGPNKFVSCPNSLKDDLDLVGLEKSEPDKFKFYRKFLNGRESE